MKRWRFDNIKIDRRFVRDLVTDMSDLAIVSAIIAMARQLNIPVVAEGVEGWQQLQKLQEIGCSLARSGRGGGSSSTWAVTKPFAIPRLHSPEIPGRRLFFTPQGEHGRQTYWLQMGYFSSAGEAARHLKILRRSYPGAFLSEARETLAQYKKYRRPPPQGHVLCHPKRQ